MQGGDRHKNAELINAVFCGEKGPIADTIIFNAGAALYVMGHSSSIEEGVKCAREQCYSGAVGRYLKEFSAFTQQLHSNSRHSPD